MSAYINIAYEPIDHFCWLAATHAAEKMFSHNHEHVEWLTVIMEFTSYIDMGGKEMQCLNLL